MKKRFFAIGCSLTSYHWPTWADILAPNFDEYQNWANTGLGNRAILERLTEIVVTQELKKDDLVIVQWSSPHRFDLHHPQMFPREHWWMGGNIHLNPRYDEKWIQSYWNELSYLMHTLNCMILADSLLKATECSFYFLSMHNEYKKETVELKPHLQFIKNNIEFLPPLLDSIDKYNFPNKILRQNDGKLKEDLHPSPRAYFKYISNLFNTYDYDLDFIEAAEKIIDESEDYDVLARNFKEKLDWSMNDNWVKGI